MKEIIDMSICEWSEAKFLFFSENIWGDFIYYSHLLPAISALIVTIFVYLNSPKNKSAQALLFTGVSFAIWCFMDLFLWSSEKIDWIMFTWSSLIYFQFFIYIGCLYFMYAFVEGKFPNFWTDVVIFLLTIPLFLFTHTKLNLTGFDFTNCWREAIEGPLWQPYIYNVGIFIAFSLGNIIGSIETDWEIGQVGLFGMPVFLAFIGYTVVKYESFRLKVVAAEALFSATFMLLLSLLFVRSIDNARVIALSTIALFSVLGLLI